MKERVIIILAAFLVIIAMLSADHYRSRVKQLEGERNRLSVELAHAQVPLQRDTIRDSVEVVTQTVVEVVPRKLKEALAADQQLIKELRLKVRQLEALQTTTIETSDTTPAHHDAGDSLFYYSDQWADLRLSLKDTTFYYNIRDSLATVVYHEYKHRFLWWKWGVKGYMVKVVNFNPHSRVTYNKYIRAEK